ncbi:TerD family protein [Nocardioides sp. JQ2195]|uniref:TerD family protein n=1 Tax=Nocardioides sp. JQ2195 TaxID=2592334 RepID=UPI00143ECAE3|nr:TerD family protein [Nocardioides sp. JQ2195]QIX27204.1 TerD family protein [Nocardioides sp. JQ2195]
MTEVIIGSSGPLLLGAKRCAAVVDVRWEPKGVPTGLFALIEDAQGKLLSRDHVVFGRRPDSPDRAVFLRSTTFDNGAVHTQLQIDLESLPSAAQRIELVLGARVANVTLEALGSVSLETWDPRTGSQDLSFVSPPPGVSKCQILGLLLRSSDGGWEFEAKGEPVDVDFSSLVRHRL